MDVRLVLASLLFLSVTATAQGGDPAPTGQAPATTQDPDKPVPQPADILGELTREKERLQQEIDYAKTRAKGAKAMLADKLGRRGQSFHSIDAGTNIVAPTAPVMRKARLLTQPELDNQPDDLLMIVNGQAVRRGAFDELMSYLSTSPSSGDDSQRAQRVLFELIRTQAVVAAFPENGADGQVGDVLGQIESGKPIQDFAKSVGTVQGAQEDGSVEITRNTFLGVKIEQVAFTLEDGKRSRPFRTPGGIVILQKDSMEKGASPELDKVKAHIVQVPWQADPVSLQKAQAAAATGQVEVLVREQAVLDALPGLYKPTPVAPMQDSAGQELVMMQRTLAKIEETIAQTQDAASPDSKSQLEQLIRQRDQLKAAIAEMSAKEKEGDAVQPKPVPAPQKPIPQKPGQDAPVKKQ